MTRLSCVYSSFLQQTDNIHGRLILALNFLGEVVCICIKNLSGRSDLTLRELGFGSSNPW